MDDQRRDDSQREEEDSLMGRAPAQWEQRAPGGLQQNLGEGEQEYIGEEGQATHLADDQMSLQSKLAGGGRDAGEQAGAEYTKLCPACKSVTQFVQGVCTKCNYRDGDPLPEDTGFAAGYEPQGMSPGLITGLVVALIVVVLIILGFIFGPKLFGGGGDKDGGSTTSQPVAATGTSAQATGEEGAFAGGFNAVVIDDAFLQQLAGVLEDGNAAWEAAGSGCYVYRYNIFEDTVPATSQLLRVTAFLGGTDAEACAIAPGDQPLRDAVQAYIDGLDARPGVSASIRLEYLPDGSYPESDDVYLRYGYWYGKDHWSDLQPIVENLEAAKESSGYPGMLREGMLRGNLKTRGGFFFIADGAGYLPIYKTDASGNIIMGTGSGLSSFMPEECTDYLLVLYTRREKDGLDLFGDEGIVYYREHIQPFPYEPQEPITNMPLNPDGEPDGIACIVKTGQLVHLEDVVD